MTNLHTLTIGSVHLVLSLILVTDGELVDVTSNVVGSPGILVPVGIHTISSVDLLVPVYIIIVIIMILKTPPTIFGKMAFDVADLAGGIDPRRGATVATATTTSPARI